MLCACEDTTPLKFGGAVFLYVSECVCLCLCCVNLCYLIFLYEFKKLIKIKMSVIQYL